MVQVELTAGKKPRDWFVAFIKDRKGATAVEFALIAAPFLAIIVALVQTFLLFFAQAMLENVVRQMGRIVMTGQVQTQQMSQSAFKTLVCNKGSILFTCAGLMVDVQVVSDWSSAGMPTLTFDGNGNVNNTWQFNPGTGGDPVVVRVMYLWPMFFGPIAFNLANQPNNTRLIMASAAFQNEPAAP
jgi:Flp pilus assembly protein TadG